MLLRAALLSTILFEFASAGRECVWILGQVQCNKDPKKNENVEVRVYDRDSWGPLKLIDPDDLMGVTFTVQDGKFQLDGCGDDFDWLPGVKNTPEPYIEIRHYCNNDRGETLTLPEFNRFVPDNYEVGIIELDAGYKGPTPSRLSTPKALSGAPSSAIVDDGTLSSAPLRPNLK